MGYSVHDIPLSVIAQWPLPNFVDPERRTWFPGYAIALQAIATIVVAARLWTRLRRLSGAFGLDDIFIITAWVFATLLTTTLSLGTIRYGYDRHSWDNKPETFVNTALNSWMNYGLFLISNCFTKVSVLLFFRRLSAGTCNRLWKSTIIAFMIFTVAYTLVFLLFLLLACRPLDSYWLSLNLSYSKKHHCSSERVIGPLAGSCSVFSDAYAVVIPAMILWNVMMPRKQKIGLFCIFGVSVFIVAAGIARSVSLARATNSDNGDLTWAGFNVFVWSQLENQLAIICASAPSLKVFLERYLGGPLSQIYASSKQSTDGTNSSRVSSVVPERLQQPIRSIRRSDSVRSLRQSAGQRPLRSEPQVMEMPLWEERENEGISVWSPTDVEYYDRYLAGKYGPPPPPKDLTAVFKDANENNWV